MVAQFHRATKSVRKAKIAFVGPPGSGKTYSALLVARGMGGKIALIDTENESASLYAGRIAEFDSCNLEAPFSPRTYVEAINAAEEGQYNVLIVDSLSQAWSGKGGILEMVDQATARSQSQNKFGVGWREATPEHNKLVDALVRCSCHLIVTMRTKMEYTLEKDERTGKVTPKKVGLAPVQREGLEYEMDLVIDFNTEHTAVVSKSRYASLADQVINRPTEELGKMILSELSDGAVVAPLRVPTENHVIDFDKATGEIKEEVKPEESNVISDKLSAMIAVYKVPIWEIRALARSKFRQTLYEQLDQDQRNVLAEELVKAKGPKS